MTVVEGAKLLDSKKRGWWKRVDRPIDMGSYTNCVLGQVYGDLHEGLMSVLPKDPYGRPDRELQVKYGFHFRELDPSPEKIRRRSAEWQSEVDRRVRAKEPVVVGV